MQPKTKEDTQNLNSIYKTLILKSKTNPNNTIDITYIYKIINQFIVYDSKRKYF